MKTEHVEALRKAAQHIETHPASYDFYAWKVPCSIDGVGCLLAWVGFFAGMPTGTSYLRVAERVKITPYVGQAAVNSLRCDGTAETIPAALVAKWARMYIRSCLK